MNSLRAAAAYKKVQMETSPARILDGLYERLLRDLREAKEHVEARRVADKGKSVDHALLIIGELNNALDYRASPDLCEQLGRLYSYTRERVLHGSVRLEPAAFDEAAQVVTSLRDGFRDAAKVAQ